MAGSEAAEKRSLLVCIGTRAEENAALWRWACACFLEPQRDAISFVFARSETTQLLSSNRVLHSHTPPEWMPPAIAKHELLDKFVTPPRFLEIVTDLGPGDAIVEWLERSEIDRPDVVLLGSRGFTGLRRFLLGSVSSYIMETEAAPCLVVRSSLPRRAVWGGEGAQEEAREEGGPSEVPATAAAAAPPPPPTPTPSARGRVVGIAVDGTPEGTTALVQWARQFVLRPDDRVTILHGRPDKPKTDDELEAVDRAIEAMNAALAALRAVRGELDAPAKAALLAEGDVREAVVEWVEASGADVLLVGSRGLGGALKRAVLGSVSTYAVQHAACAVLVVSAPVLKAMARAEQSEQELPAAATAKDAAAAVVPPPDAAGQHE